LHHRHSLSINATALYFDLDKVIHHFLQIRKKPNTTAPIPKAQHQNEASIQHPTIKPRPKNKQQHPRS
jgi:hypothetical protein